MSLSKVLAVGGILAMGAGLYYLSKESSHSQYDPKIHTNDMLYNLLDDMFFEYACGYIYYFNMIMSYKERGQLSK
eukprot:CAMPEP_0202962060 /NCGR_PEP_ID=MMETSP1396-20130829/6163_1 /ASSEMBLY_ACC=CAM_ASM_000872 /TAXON_ID= /ORGANISM="Pseudokeronopsis sp., Strain Brazil" /LENGTH=74 /DNA_ID=CAMNT_0049682375 /DNA_START=1 /DNA_END=225 /DNA_ORIENTATION=-